MPSLGESASLPAFYAAEDRQIAKEKRWEQMADEAAQEGTFRKIALERMYDPGYDLAGELSTHCYEQCYRRLMVAVMHFDTDIYHPYNQPGGLQIWKDDMRIIRDQINGWLVDQEAAARDEFIRHCKEVDA